MGGGNVMHRVWGLLRLGFIVLQKIISCLLTVRVFHQFV